MCLSSLSDLPSINSIQIQLNLTRSHRNRASLPLYSPTVIVFYMHQYLFTAHLDFVILPSCFSRVPLKLNVTVTIWAKVNSIQHQAKARMGKEMACS